MKCITFAVCSAIASIAHTALATSAADVLTNPESYQGREIQLEGVARVPGAFYLYSDSIAAAEKNRAKALLIRANTYTTYRQFDRQWVRITGVMSGEQRPATDPGNGILLHRIKLLRDRPAPRIRDSSVLGVFRNETNQPILIAVRYAGGTTEFMLKPHQTDINPIDEGEISVSPTTGADSAPLSQQHIGNPIVKRELKFRQLLVAGYEYSPEWSDERTIYLRVTKSGIDIVPTTQAKGWAEAAGRKIPED